MKHFCTIVEKDKRGEERREYVYFSEQDINNPNAIEDLIESITRQHVIRVSCKKPFIEHGRLYYAPCSGCSFCKFKFDRIELAVDDQA